VIFAESDLIELEGKHPKLDVRRCAADVERWAQTHLVHNPLALCAAWLAKNPRRYPRSEKPPAVTWMRHADGSPLTESERRNLDAYRVERGEIPPPTVVEERSTPSYAAFRLGVIAEVLESHLTPAAVADRLAQHGEKFALERSSLGPEIVFEIGSQNHAASWLDLRDPPPLPPEAEPGFVAVQPQESAW